MVLRNGDAAELGCLVRALEEFSLDPQLGAHASQGCGIVRCHWQVSRDGKPLGTVKVQPFEALHVEGDELVKLFDEAKSAFAESVKNSPLAQAS